MITVKEIPENEALNIVELPIDEIKPNPYQQRRYFDFYSLNRLTESIKRFGVIQPITVRIVNGKNYELVAGERRLRASRAAGLKPYRPYLWTPMRRKAPYFPLLRISREKI